MTSDSFMLLNDDDLRELGFKMGARKIVLRWIQSQEHGVLPSLSTLIPTSSSSSDANMTPTRPRSDVSTSVLTPVQSSQVIC